MFRLGIVPAVLGLAPALYAQRSTSLEAFVGAYRPAGSFEPASIFATDLPNAPSDLAGSAFGGAADVGIGRRFGIAAQFAVARSKVGESMTPDGPRGPTGVDVDLGQVVAEYDVSPKPSVVHVRLDAGPAFVRHAGESYRPYGSPTSYGAAVGATVGVPLSRHLALVGAATKVFYHLDVEMRGPDSSMPFERGPQQDLLLHVGLAWTHR